MPATSPCMRLAHSRAVRHVHASFDPTGWNLEAEQGSGLCEAERPAHGAGRLEIYNAPTGSGFSILFMKIFRACAPFWRSQIHENIEAYLTAHPSTSFTMGDWVEAGKLAEGESRWAGRDISLALDMVRLEWRTSRRSTARRSR